jgi:7-carboxy-7-deazaguanine synthase
MIKNSKETAAINEIFSSIQGEGILIGRRQLFIRFSGCNLNCNYCDAPGTAMKNERFRVEFPPGTSGFMEEKNLITPRELIGIIDVFLPITHHSVSLTGGEPLLQENFLLGFLPLLKDKKQRIYLETNGTLVRSLEKVAKYTDFIAMDFKLESTTKIKTPWDTHREFLSESYQGGAEVFVKIVVSTETPMEEIVETSRIIGEISREIPLVIQPLTINEAISFDGKKFLEFQNEAGKFLKDVRIIPQTHKFLIGIL